MFRRNREALTALLVAVVALSMLAVIRGDGGRVRPYLQVVTGLLLATWLADRVARFDKRMGYALCSVAIIHLIGGLMTPVGNAPTLYETWLIDGVLKFDQLAHAYGCGVLTFACAQLTVALIGATPTRRWALPVIGALMAMGLGAFNEMFEFFFGLDNPNLYVGGFENTGWDLVFNLGGALVAAGWMGLLTHPHEVDDEHQRLVGADHAASALASVGEVGRQR